VWDRGIEVRPGDEVNGFVAQETFAIVVAILPWLQQAISHFYPGSSYARTLDPEVRQLAAQRLFRPPATGSACLLPAPRRSPLGTTCMEELIQFICPHCRQSVIVEPAEGSVDPPRIGAASTNGSPKKPAKRGQTPHCLAIWPSCRCYRYVSISVEAASTGARDGRIL
jgi:hypothetical protein